MLNKINNRVYFILIALFFLAVFSSFIISNKNYRPNIIQDDDIATFPRTSSYWNNFTYIHINGNWSNAVNWGWCKGTGIYGDPYRLENITMDAMGSPTGNGIYIENSKNFYFIIKNCTIYNAGVSASYDAAITFENTNNGTIIDCNCSNNNYKGINLDTSHNNTVLGNLCNDNNQMGINLILSDNNTVKENTANNNRYYGIMIQSQSDNNSIIENTCEMNDYYANYGFGIQITTLCTNNMIGKNVLDKNNIGIHINDRCDNNVVKENILKNNELYGAKIRDYTPKSTNNTFYKNIFENPSGSNAFDNGSNTKWDNGVIGNYWHDYDGKDKNDDGIGDTPYDNIPGDAGSQDNFPIWDDGEEDDKEDEEKELTFSEALIQFLMERLVLLIMMSTILALVIIVKIRKRK